MITNAITQVSRGQPDGSSGSQGVPGSPSIGSDNATVVLNINKIIVEINGII
ncbi:MAG TPA: hypothetical protein VK609_15340 [Mucilaginibacter sp.]|nr:hypothetical protein [Mucilaginibacter sp.]